MESSSHPLEATSHREAPSVPPDDLNACSIVFVLGGPGAGKGTQCDLIAEKYDFVHISLGDVLREEIKRSGSRYGPIIEENMREGRVGPMEITVELLRDAMVRARTVENRNRFLIDGFPRKMDQALLFEQVICKPEWILALQCPADVLQQRLHGRATLGRFDDNATTIHKRINTFHSVTRDVLDYYANKGKVLDVDATGSREEVLSRIEAVLSLSPHA